VRSDDRWARLRALAARDFRRFFFADAIFGTKPRGAFGSGARHPGTGRARSAESTWAMHGCQGSTSSWLL
jgi:hypothetical protein